MNIWRIEISRLAAFMILTRRPSCMMSAILESIRSARFGITGFPDYFRRAGNQIRQIVSELLVDAFTSRAQIELGAPAHQTARRWKFIAGPDDGPGGLIHESAIRKIGIDVEQVARPGCISSTPLSATHKKISSPRKSSQRMYLSRSSSVPPEAARAATA